MAMGFGLMLILTMVAQSTSAQTVTTTIAAGTAPRAVAINPVTNKIYVANTSSNNITVIDGATNALATLAAGTLPRAVVIDPDDVKPPLQAAAVHYRIAQGPRAGQKVLRLQLAPRHPGSRESSALCANAHGFSLHAGVRCAADDRKGLEQLCRYITRPAISHERLSVNRAGQVVLKLKTAWRDGTSHHVMEPMEFMQRLAALMPRPRLHLIRFHGVLAPNATLR